MLLSLYFSYIRIKSIANGAMYAYCAFMITNDLFNLNINNFQLQY